MSDYFERLITNNKLDIADYEEFEKISRLYTQGRALELIKQPIKGNFDYKHLKKIHEYLFQDVFAWAGMDRADLGLLTRFGKMGKNGEITDFVPGKSLKYYAKEIFDDLKKQNYLKNSKNINEFSQNLGNFLMELNALHPFREGNGRTTRIFINELAKNAGYKLDLNLISQENMIEASIEASKLKPQKLQELILQNLKSFDENLHNGITQKELENMRKLMTQSVLKIKSTNKENEKSINNDKEIE